MHFTKSSVRVVLSTQLPDASSVVTNRISKSGCHWRPQSGDAGLGSGFPALVSSALRLKHLYRIPACHQHPPRYVTPRRAPRQYSQRQTEPIETPLLCRSGFLRRCPVLSDLGTPPMRSRGVSLPQPHLRCCIFPSTLHYFMHVTVFVANISYFEKQVRGTWVA